MNSWQYLSDSRRIPRIFVTLSYLYRNRILEHHDLEKKFAKFHESSRILTFINSWRFVGFVVCVEWGHKLQKCLPDILCTLCIIGIVIYLSLLNWKGIHILTCIVNVTRGTRQWSLLSPMLFNRFYLNYCTNLLVLIMAYVWEISYTTRLYTRMMSLYLLPLYQVCRNLLIRFNYSANWRFNFGIRKSKCLIPRYCADMFENDQIRCI